MYSCGSGDIVFAGIVCRLVVVASLAMSGFTPCVSQTVEPVALDRERAVVQYATPNGVREFVDWRSDAPRIDPATTVYWVALRSKIGREWDSLAALGVRDLGFAKRLRGGCLYLFDLGRQADRAIMALKSCQSFINAMPLAPYDKIAAAIWQETGLEGSFVDDNNTRIRAEVLVRGGTPPALAASLIGAYVDSVRLDSDSSSLRFVVVGKPSSLRMLGALAEVAGVTLYRKPEPLMTYSRTATQVDLLQAFDTSSTDHPPADSSAWCTNSGDTSLTGEGVTIGIYDYGVDSGMSDFRWVSAAGGSADTVLRRDSTWVNPGTFGNDYHGSMVASIAAGNGWVSSEDSMHAERFRWRGMAPKSMLYASGWNGSRHYGDVTNHSHATGSVGYYTDALHAGYDNDAYYDSVLACHDTTERSLGGDANNVAVFAVGNSGNARAYGYMQGFYSLGSTTKNAVKVGSVDQYTTVHSYGSSMGPTYDGRVGPDVVVPTYKPDRYERWSVEIDYLSLACDSDTVRWDFNGSQPWGAGASGVWGLGQGTGGTTLAFNAYPNAYVFSDSCVFPSDSGAVLRIRYRITDSVSSPELIKGHERYAKACFYWKSTATDVSDPLPDPYVLFYVRINSGWQEASIPLRLAHQIVGGGLGYGNRAWATSPATIRRVGFGMSWPVAAMTPGHHAWNNGGMYLHEDFEGTSAAAPQVSGIVALMLQQYARSHHLSGQNIHDDAPWNSSIRGLLIHTATDLVDTTPERAACPSCCPPEFLAMGDTTYSVYTKGPDYATGWGLVNAAKAVRYVDSNFVEDTVADGQLTYYTTHVSPGVQAFRVTLVWDDPAPSGVQNESNAFERKLVNDLDIYLVNPTGSTVYRPLALDHASIKGRRVPHDPTAPTAIYGVDSSFVNGQFRLGISVDTVLAHPAVPGVERTNNVEVVDVTSPDTGTWTIAVEGVDVLKNQSLGGAPNRRRQEFSLVFDRGVAATTQHTDTLGPWFSHNSYVKARCTEQGYLQISGHSVSSVAQGLRFGGAASIDSSGNLRSPSVQSAQVAWLGNPANLSGGLVFRRPDGTPTLHVSANGTVRLRAATAQGFGLF